MKTEQQILEATSSEFDLGDWYKDLLGQKAELETGAFDYFKAFDRIPRTELTTAEEIARKYQDRLTYVPATKVWYLWDGKIHRPCEDDSIVLKAVQNYFSVLRDAIRFVDEALKLNAKDDDEKAVKALKGELAKHKRHRDRLATDSGQKAVVNQLRTQLDVAPDHYERDNQFLVVRNGVIDLADYKATGTPTLLAHDPARAVYRFFDADYEAGMTHADYPQWRRYLSSSIVDWDTACLLQKGVGAAFAATHKPRAMFNLLGAPASGKSLFLSVFDKLGNGYSVMPNNQAVQANNGDTNPYQDDLKGARFVGFSEVQGKKPLDDGFIKGIMGGDKQNTRQLYAKQAPWIPQCLMFVASNMPLKIDTRDAATFGKLLPIPFPHSFTDTDPEHPIDLELEDKVLAERSGILHWVLQGMQMYWTEGLHSTAAVMEAMDSNKSADSHALQFMQELLASGLIVEDTQAPLSSCLLMGEAYKGFRTWAESQGISRPPLKSTFTDDIASFYHNKQNSGGWRFVHLAMSEKFKQANANSIWYITLMDHL